LLNGLADAAAQRDAAELPDLDGFARKIRRLLKIIEAIAKKRFAALR
jgi:hypothetical protein